MLMGIVNLVEDTSEGPSWRILILLSRFMNLNLIEKEEEEKLKYI